jgi:adenylate cyclase class IV
MEKQFLEHVEFETKYRIDDHQLIEFKQIMDSLNEEKKFIYVEGPDYYWTYPAWWFHNNPEWDESGTFVRFRKPSYGLDNGSRQVTWKYKPKEAKNNIQRIENNWDIKDKTEEASITKQLQCSGCTFNFSIVKNCHIYILGDATLVFYTVYDTTDGKPKKADSFIEIEVNEENMKSTTAEQAWAVITKYEKLLENLGLNAQKRLKKSLFAMYKRDLK